MNDIPFRESGNEIKREYEDSIRLGRSRDLWGVWDAYSIEDGVIKRHGNPRYYFPVANPQLLFDLAKVKADVFMVEDEPQKHQAASLATAPFVRVRLNDSIYTTVQGPAQATGDTGAALRFVRQWGFLDNMTQAPPPTVFTSETEGPHDGQYLWLFWIHAYTVKAVLDLHKAIQSGTNRVSEVLKRVTTPVAGAERNHNLVSWLYGCGHELYTGGINSSGYTPEEVAKVIIAQTVSANLTGMAPTLYPVQGDDARQFELGYHFRSLLNVVYWHLVHVLTENRPLIQCKECRGYFVETRKGQRFCPPPPESITAARKTADSDGNMARVQSKCANRFRTREYRAKNMKKGGNENG